MTFHARNNFCSRFTSAITLYAQVQFHAKYPFIDSQSDREFTFSYAILPNILEAFKMVVLLFWPRLFDGLMMPATRQITIQRMAWLLDSAVYFVNTYPLDSDLSGKRCYSAYEQPVPDVIDYGS